MEAKFAIIVPIVALAVLIMGMTIIVFVWLFIITNDDASNAYAQIYIPPTSFPSPQQSFVPLPSQSLPLLPPVQTSSSGISGIIIPLYIYPTSFAWNLVANEKIMHPNVPIVTIINPNSGPGTYQDPNYVNGINKLRSAGVTVIGYVYTSYASRPITAVEQDVRVYKTFYPNINGIMFDEMNNVAGAGHESYYSTVSNYAKALGLSFTVGNAGADVPSSFIGTVDTILNFERQGYPTISYLDGWHSQYSKYRWGMTSYGDQYLSDAFVYYAKQYSGYIYITDDVLPNPYDTLPSYFDRLIQDLD